MPADVGCEFRRGGELLIVERAEGVVHEVLEHIERLIRVIAGEKVHLAEHLEGIDE